MKLRRLGAGRVVVRTIVAGVVVVAAAALPACAKSHSADGVPTASSTAVNGRAVLDKALATLGTSTVHVSAIVTSGSDYVRVEGDVDPVAGVTAVHTTTSDGRTTQMRVIGSDAYVFGVTGYTRPWVHIDLNKMPETNPIHSSVSPMSSLGILGGVVAMEPTSFQRFHGTTDLQRAAAHTTDVGQRAIMQRLANEIGPGGAAVPFDISVDDQGRIKTLTYDLTAQGVTSNSNIHFYDYGKPVTVQAPASKDVQEAEAAVYTP
jgi:hypothetical protein